MEKQEKVKVSVRIRPLLNDERKDVWEVKGSTITTTNVSLQSQSEYTFDHIYGETVTTSQMYSEVAKDVVNSSLRGYNGTIFAYGQTGSGKTYTVLGTESHAGILPLACDDIFKSIRESKSEDSELVVRVSVVEIYNEHLTDMLHPEVTNLKIREDPHKGVFIEGIRRELALTVEEAVEHFNTAEKNRHIGYTTQNKVSSRSHSIFRVEVENLSEAGIKSSVLTFVDLAGCERSFKAGTQGERLKEGGYINKSLLALGQVISKLSTHTRQHVPYRDSKLTRILENSVGGNSKSSVVCTVSLAKDHVEETHNTLLFATRTRKVRNRPKVNQVRDDKALAMLYYEQIKSLKRRLVVQTWKRATGAALFKRASLISEEQSVSEVKDQLKEAEARERRESIRAYDAEGELEKAKQRIQQLEETNARLEKELKEAKKRRSVGGQIEVHDLHLKLASATARLSALEGVNEVKDELEQQLDELQRKQRQRANSDDLISSELLRSEAELSRVKEENTSLLIRIQTLEESQSRSSDVDSHLRRRIEELEALLSAEKQKTAKLGGQNALMKRELETVANNLSTIQHQLN